MVQAYCVKCKSKEGDESLEGYNHEEWQARDSGLMSNLWHKDVQVSKAHIVCHFTYRL